MRRRELFLLLVSVACHLPGGGNIYSQSIDVDEHKFEVGGQFSLVANSIVSQVNDLSVQCVTIPCPPSNFAISRTRKTQPGFGGRIGYNLNSHLAIEAELNVFPAADWFSQPEQFNDGHFLEGLFGLKVGKRFDKAGIFVKARPGFLHASKGDLEPRTDTGCIAIFPPPAGCFQTTSEDSFVLDLGGVVEIYPTTRTLIRFDVGDTIFRLRERNVSTTFNRGLSDSRLIVWRMPAETTHNFQGSIGIGFRF